MAILNPLQAFLNTLVYRRWTEVTLPKRIRDCFKRKVVESERLRERVPLLGYEPVSYDANGDTELGSIDRVYSLNSCRCG